MLSNQGILIVGLCAAVAIVVFDRNFTGTMDTTPAQPDYLEVASVLWKARVYRNEIEFVVDDRIIYTAHFNNGETHVSSTSYRNLNGYFDPVFITVWKRGGSFSAKIFDPVQGKTLKQVESGSEIDVSVSTDNKIVFTYTDPELSEEAQAGEMNITWPN